MPLMVMILLVFSALVQSVHAAADLPRFEDCLKFEWDYDEYEQPDLAQSQPGHLGLFRLYLARTSGGHKFCGNNPLCFPAAIIPAIPTMVTELPCSSLFLYEPGTYYAVVTAVSMDMTDESGPSNEVAFTYGNATDSTPPPEPVGWQPPPAYGTPSPIVVDLPPPPPPLGFGRQPPAQPPRDKSGSPWISDSCVWNGTC